MGGSCSELWGWLLFLLFPAGALDEVADAVVLEVQHREVELESLAVAVEVGLLEQFSTEDGQDLDHVEVRTSADHALKALRADGVVHCGHFFGLFEPSMLRIGHVSSPSAVDVLPLLQLLNIHALDELPALTLQLTEKRNIRLLVVFLFLSVLSDLIVQQTADKLSVNDVNLDRILSTKLITALGNPSLLTWL